MARSSHGGDPAHGAPGYARRRGRALLLASACRAVGTPWRVVRVLEAIRGFEGSRRESCGAARVRVVEGTGAGGARVMSDRHGRQASKHPGNNGQPPQHQPDLPGCLPGPALRASHPDHVRRGGPLAADPAALARPCVPAPHAIGDCRRHGDGLAGAGARTVRYVPGNSPRVRDLGGGRCGAGRAPASACCGAACCLPGTHRLTDNSDHRSRAGSRHPPGSGTALRPSWSWSPWSASSPSWSTGLMV